MTSIGEMSDRARDVFRMVVEAYLESGQPVGSRTISRTSSLNLSPASIRNVMQDLEESGLLAAPHTSAGRIPTEPVAIVVGSDGSVENRVVDLPPGVTGSTLAEVGNYVSARLSGLTLSEAQARLKAEIGDGRAALDKAAQKLVERGLALWSEDGARRPVMIVRGQANLIDESAAADLERVRQLLDELEGKEEIARLLDQARAGASMKIFIGSENELFALSGSSVIAAPYRGQDGKVVGVVGVIGPTRLNYARVVPMVDFTAKTLSRLLR
jgi:heat-inducible transcriptional repressor